jgi:diaminohydroxyphosphoribosylaminopyrimidine deaminase/5-amino-6-(5-phosphoribosylamino)uracil reductase
MVGAVIVLNDKIIGEGFHQKYGDAHAEVNAINSIEDKLLLKKSTLYVNLEPCSHYGKTPPCAYLIVKHQLKRVVVATLDSNPEVAGKGIKHLEQHHIEVNVGVLKEEALDLNRRFFTFHEKKRPFIILKWAQSTDGFIDIDRKDEKPKINWISNQQSKRLVHQWRAEESAILIGYKTVINDNPSLTTREIEGPNPLRIIIDPSDRLKENRKNYSLFNDGFPTIIYNHLINEKYGNCEYIGIVKEGSFLDQILTDLYKKEIQSLIIEGGRFTLESFIKNGLWDEARVIRGRAIFNTGLMAPSFKFTPLKSQVLGSDIIEYYRNL